MKKQIRNISIGLVIACICLLGSGCFRENEKKKYTATVANGTTWTNLTYVRGGIGFSIFRKDNGKRLTLDGNYFFEEQ